MAHESESASSDVKVHFTTREGTYQQITTSDFFNPKRGPYVSPSAPSRTALVKTSYVRVKQNENDEEEEDCICFTAGKTLFYFTYNAFRQLKPCIFLDKRQYKGSAPSCHDINQYTATSESVKVAVGFLAGQVQIIDVRKKESLQIMNEVESVGVTICRAAGMQSSSSALLKRSVDKSSVTCVKWYPNSENMILSAHLCGFMYTYDVTQLCSEVPPIYYSQPYKVDDGYSIFTVKSKSTSASPNSFNSSSTPNPLYKWVMSTDGTAVCAFEFSPCSRFVAVVTQNGYLRVIDHQTFESHGCMKSYFGGLMTCSWSPDGRFIATGGEDDLITVWSFCQQCVVARGSSHKSWVSDIAFDPVLCVIPSDADMKAFYGVPTVDEFLASRKPVPVQSASGSSENLSDTARDCDNRKSPNLLKFKKLNSKDHPTDPKPSQCNGDSKLPLSADKMNRLRTYSNVSRLSRMSIGVERPPVCYRLGSVGQDSQLCLWEIDESTFDLINRKSSVLKRREASTKESKKQSPVVSRASDNIAEMNSDLQLVAASSSSELSSGSSSNVQYYLHNQTPAHKQPESNPLGDDSRSSSVPHSINAVTPTKKDARSKNTYNGFSVIRKFATIGSHDRSRKEPKAQGQQHKRNLSLPHFGLRTSTSHNGSSKSGLNKPEQPAPKIFGTVLCPSLEDTPMLDPLTCKKISQSRLTSLCFKQDCILISCQDGFLQTWRRPNVIDDDKPPLSGNDQVKQNGTVV